MPRWWFNAATGACEPFTYGGCGGNGNNFETPEQCESSCSPPPVVGMPVHPCPSPVACPAVLPACSPGCSNCKVTTVTERSCTQCAVLKAECHDVFGLPGSTIAPCPPSMMNPAACSCGTETTTDAHGCTLTVCKAPIACVASVPACRPGCSDCKVTTVTEGSCSQCAVYKAECQDAPVGLPAGLPGPCAVGPCAAGELCTDVSVGMHTCAPKPQMCCMAAATCGLGLTVPTAESSSTPCTQAEYDAGACTSHAICCHRVYCRTPPPCPPSMINPAACACGTETTTDAHGGDSVGGTA
eukprot:gene19674-47849_t